MSRLYELKTNTEYYEPLVLGKKSFDVTNYDIVFKVDDYVKFTEVENNKYTGRYCIIRVDNIIKDNEYSQASFCIIVINKVTPCEICEFNGRNFAAEPCYLCRGYDLFKLKEHLQQGLNKV